MKLPEIERHILSRPGDWTFDKWVSKVFDSHVKKSVPCYSEIQQMIAGISRHILPDGALVYDLGTATGEIIRNIHRANPQKEICYIGIDRSQHMIRQAEKKCRGIKNVTFCHADIGTFDFVPCDLVVSAFTLQFTDMEHRGVILKRIREALKPGGYLILCEKVILKDDQFNTLYIKVHEDWKSSFFTEQEIVSKRNSLVNVMKLLSVPEYLELLGSAGFQKAEVFFRWCNFAGILAR